MSSNLLTGKWTIPRLETLLRNRPPTPLLPPLGASPWKRAAEKPLVRRLAFPLRILAEKEWATPQPRLTDALYASFRRTGVRLPFERVYFERRRRLARAAAGLLLSAPDDPWRERLLRSLTDKFTAVFEEVSWALPAHVNWHNDDRSGKEPLQIDLFAAETANLMAEMLDLFGAVLPAALQERVRARLQRDIFRNFVDRHAEFHWPKVTHNWNAVCHQGVLGAALSQLDDPALLARMLFLARRSLPLFLGGFAKDGGCSEGIGYWSYGFGWFVRLNEQLEMRTGGRLSLFDGDAHVRRIARFGPGMALAGGKLVNFSDNGAEGGLPASLLSYLGRRLRDADCARAAREGFRRLAAEGLDAHAERCDFFCLGRLFLDCPAEAPSAATGAALPKDRFLPDLAVMVAHGRDRKGRLWDFAAKAGHNDEHHNHNDCGGWLLNVDGVRLVAEIGAPEYTKGFFGPERYTFLAARTLGHSLPLINGREQAAGREFSSRIVSHRLTPSRADLEIDVTAAYPKDAGCRRFVRSFRFDKKAGALTVRDAFRLDAPFAVESGLVSLLPIRIARGIATIRSDRLTLDIRPDPGTKLARVETHAYRAHEGADATAYRLVMAPAKEAVALRLGVTLTVR